MHVHTLADMFMCARAHTYRTNLTFLTCSKEDVLLVKCDDCFLFQEFVCEFRKLLLDGDVGASTEACDAPCRKKYRDKRDT